MTKLFKQDKIDIYNQWKYYGKSSCQLGKEYGITASNLRYLFSLIDRHGIKITNRT